MSENNIAATRLFKNEAVYIKKGKVYPAKKETQIEFLKRVGRYGSSRDPQWNRKTKRHDCCGATRAYYHKKDCPLCQHTEDDNE